MTIGDDDPRVYQALALPNEAIANGGDEILRVGIIKDDIYVSARRAFHDPEQWGDVLAYVTGRIAELYAAEAQGLSKKDAAVRIAESYVAGLFVDSAKATAGRKSKAAKAAKTSKKANKTTKKSARPAARRKKR